MSSRLPARIGTFRLLEVVKALADHGSVSAAAEKLHLTQPTVSMQLAKLADAVGGPLYEVIGRKLYMTDLGRLVAACAEEVLDSVNRLDSAAAALSGLKRGRIRFGVVTTAKYFLPHLLGPFCREYPDVEIALNVANRQTMIERLKHNRDDIYIFSHPPQELDVEAVEFLENPLSIIAPPDHPLVKRRRIPLAEIAEIPMLLRERGSGTRYAAELFFRQHGLQLREKMTIESNEAIKHAVMAGLGIGVLSEHTLERGDKIQLARLRVEGFPIVHHWYWVYPKGKRLSPAVSYFMASVAGVGLEFFGLR